jgi:hypothetical protein
MCWVWLHKKNNQLPYTPTQRISSGNIRKRGCTNTAATTLPTRISPCPIRMQRAQFIGTRLRAGSVSGKNANSHSLQKPPRARGSPPRRGGPASGGILCECGSERI